MNPFWGNLLGRKLNQNVAGRNLLTRNHTALAPGQTFIIMKCVGDSNYESVKSSEQKSPHHHKSRQTGRLEVIQCIKPHMSRLASLAAQHILFHPHFLQRTIEVFFFRLFHSVKHLICKINIMDSKSYIIY